MLNNLLYKLYSSYIKLFKSGLIVSRPMIGLDKTLFFQSDQYLNFYRSKVIEHESYVKSKLEQFLYEGAIVFDIGANVGQYALFFSEKIGQEGNVISVEPDKNNFSLLTFNKLKNRCDNLTVLNNGAGDKVKSLEFFRDTNTGGRTSSFIESFVKMDNVKEKDTIELTTITELIDRFGIPDFVKIDVEGFESKVLDGIDNLNVKTSFLIEVRNETKNGVYDYFKAHSFNCWIIHESSVEKVTDRDQIKGFSNLLFSTKNNLKF